MYSSWMYEYLDSQHICYKHALSDFYRPHYLYIWLNWLRYNMLYEKILKHQSYYNREYVHIINDEDLSRNAKSQTSQDLF